MNTRFLDDLIVGDRFISGGLTLTEAEIIDFAFRYDPQPFHLDAVAAAESPYGGLIASGFQSLALCFRLFIQSGVLAGSSMGSPGIDELRWLKPVFPGDTLRVRMRVLQSRPMASRPGVGLSLQRWEVDNQHGQTVMTMQGWGMYRQRGTLAAESGPPVAGD